MKNISKVNENEPQNSAPPRDNDLFLENVKNSRLVPYPLGIESNIAWWHMNNEKSSIYNGGMLTFNTRNNASDIARSQAVVLSLHLDLPK